MTKLSKSMNTHIFFFYMVTLTFSSFAEDSYQIRAGDVLEISVWREDDLNREITVRPDGYFSFPLAGDIKAQGKTVSMIRKELVEGLEKYISEPEVNINVTAVVGNKVYVVGKVANPGAFIMSHPLDVMQALSVAGGMTTFAGVNKIKILRRKEGEQIAIPFKYAEVEDGENLEQNIILEQGDIVVVP